MEIYYFTFGKEHIHPVTHEPLQGYYVEIVASSYEVARAKMHELFKNQWVFQFNESEFGTIHCPRGCYQKINKDEILNKEA